MVKNLSKKQQVKDTPNTLKHLLHELVQVPQYAFKKGNPHSCHNQHYAAEILVKMGSSVKISNSDRSHNT